MGINPESQSTGTSDSRTEVTHGVHLAREDSPGMGGVPPVRLGDYEIASELARGGMGVVYRALDVRLNRWVALKTVADAGFSSGEELERFRVEAEAAAELNHPNIVPIYEVGVDQGRHFFSMRLIEGPTLTQEIARFSKETEAAARLLMKVARAVHYAHQRGILHRDLKPGNILLDARDEPFVTDFGLAKRLEADNGLTQTGAIMGTPQYMAPEQAAGKVRQLTTGADVYSLGAIQYQLLTGQPPFQGGTSLDILRRVMEEEPLRPRQLVPTVDRDLESICLKCLEKEPDRRYSSADDLAEDLERWLRHEPISARPITTMQRAVKWARRRPAIAGLAVAVVVVAITGFTATLWQLRAANLARTDAEQRAESETKARKEADKAKAEALNEKHSAKALNDLLLEDILSRANPQKGPSRELKVIDALQSASANIDKRFTNMPNIAATLHQTMGKAFVGLSDYESGAEHLRAAVNLYSKTEGSNSVASAVAEADLARAYDMAGKSQEAESILNKVIPFLESTSPSDALRPKQFLARIKASQGEVVTAEKLFVDSMGVDFKPEQVDRKNFRTASDVGELWMQKGDLLGSEKLLTQVLAVSKEVEGEDGIATLLASQRLGYVKLMLNKLSQAEEILRSAWDRSNSVLGEEHHYSLAAGYNLAVALRKLGRLNDALDVIHKTTVLREKHFGLSQRQSLSAFWEEAEVLRQLNRHDEVAAIRMKILPGYESVFGMQSKNSIMLRAALAKYLEANAVAACTTNNYTDALNYLLRAHDFHIKNQKVGTDDSSHVAKMISDCYQKLGNSTLASEWSVKADAPSKLP